MSIDESRELDKLAPARYTKQWSSNPMRSRAVVEINGRTFDMRVTGYKGPTSFIYAWEYGKQVPGVVAKRACDVICQLQRHVLGLKPGWRRRAR